MTSNCKWPDGARITIPSIERRSGDKAFSLFYYRQGELIAVDSVNRPGEHLLARKLLETHVTPEPALAGDPAKDLRDLLR